MDVDGWISGKGHKNQYFLSMLLMERGFSTYNFVIYYFFVGLVIIFYLQNPVLLQLSEFCCKMLLFQTESNLK